MFFLSMSLFSKYLFSDEKGLSAFLMNLYQEKDELKDNFLTTGSFERNGKFPINQTVELGWRLPVLVNFRFCLVLGDLRHFTRHLMRYLKIKVYLKFVASKHFVFIISCAPSRSTYSSAFRWRPGSVGWSCPARSFR